MNKKTIKGYKGFNGNLQCRDFQYEIGKEYDTDTATVCESGFHFCENPLDVLEYYSPSTSRFCEVEGSGNINDGKNKKSCTHIKIGAEIGLGGLIKAGVKFVLGHVKWDDVKESNTGDRSAATNTGYRSAATNTGDQSAASVDGKESIAIVTGRNSKAKGALGCWIVLTERGEWNGETYPILDVKAFKVDGETIKEKVYYQLINGEAVKLQ